MSICSVFVRRRRSLETARLRFAPPEVFQQAVSGDRQKPGQKGAPARIEFRELEVGLDERLVAKILEFARRPAVPAQCGADLILVARDDLRIRVLTSRQDLSDELVAACALKHGLYIM